MSTTITLPSAAIARTIENTIISAKQGNHRYTRLAYDISARLISTTVFPIFLLLELVFTQIPKLLFSITFHRDSEKLNKHLDKIGKYCLAILLHPLGLLSADVVSGFFLEKNKCCEIIYFPKTLLELQSCVKRAIKHRLKICVVGSGTSLGTQTTGNKNSGYLLINLQKLREITFVNDKAVEVQAGAKWKDLMIVLNKHKKSILVKQPMSDFSLGGAAGINCHGWDHINGAFCNTVLALRIVNDKGEIQTLTPKDPAFKCFFGTLGYFGIIASITIELTENTYLIQKGKLVNVEEFLKVYEKQVKGKEDIRLCYGKVCLSSNDNDEDPRYFREVCMVYCQQDPSSYKPLVSKNFTNESTLSKLLEEIGFYALNWFPYSIAKHIISLRWTLGIKEFIQEKRITRNEILHFPTNILEKLHCSNLHTLWLQEYFIDAKALFNFLTFLGLVLESNRVSVVNATIRFVPKDRISILPYAKKDCIAIVICFHQKKNQEDLTNTKRWIRIVTQVITILKGTYYMAYMPFQTQEQFIECYGLQNIETLHIMKSILDPHNIFSSAFTDKFFSKDRTVATLNKDRIIADSEDVNASNFFGKLCINSISNSSHNVALFSRIVKDFFASPSARTYFTKLCSKVFSD
jgi:UDP-N-acetylenolpyruvoylglucosamine reductase